MQMPDSRFYILLTIILGGCAGTPSQEKLETDVGKAVISEADFVPQEWSESVNTDAVKTGWIDSFEDPVLTSLVVEAIQNNRDLASAVANIDRAWSFARQAGAALGPEVSLAASGARSGSVDTSQFDSTSLNLGLQVSWEADVWGRLESGQRSAVASAQAVEADYAAAQQSLVAATAKAYFTAIEANIQVGIAQETLALLEETQRIVEVKYKNGLASGQDIALARSDLATTRERLVALEGSYRDAVRALEFLLGRYPGADMKLRASLPKVPPPPPVGLPSELLERRPDIIAAERRVAVAFNATEQAKAAKLPTIGLTGSLGGASNSLSDLLDPANVAWSIGANLLAPLYDGGRRQEAVNIATAEQEQSLAAYGKAALTAFNELETNLDQGQTLDQRRIDLAVAASEADKAYKIAKLRYEEGEEDLLSVLTIQQRAISAKSSSSSLDRLLLEQRVNLNLALGGGWSGYQKDQ